MASATGEESSFAAKGWKTSLPALTLMLMAPLTAEVLPGATRFSSLFVLPIEMCVWGGGALMIRDFVRRSRLGWLDVLLLGIALAIAEECVIQQSSLAPMVLQLKGKEYARALGVNYVYFLWALVYEATFVVIVPIHLVELIFPRRRESLWLSRAGLVAVATLFLLGGFLAWYSWTQIARPMVFHVPAYTPPLGTILIAVIAICGLVFLALGPPRHALSRDPCRLDLLNPGCSASRGRFGLCSGMVSCFWVSASPPTFPRRWRSAGVSSSPRRSSSCCRDGRPISAGIAATSSPWFSARCWDQ